MSSARRPRFLSGSALPALVLASTLTWSQERDARLPLDATPRLAPEVRAAIDRRPAAESGWESEARVGAVSAWLRSSSPEGAGGPVASGFRLRRPSQGLEEPVGLHGPFTIHGPTRELEELTGSEAEAAMRALLAETGEFHTKGARDEGELFVTDAHVRGPYSHWEAGWRFEEGGVRLEWLEVGHGLEARSAPGAELFRDATGSLFRGERAFFDRVLAPGISNWRNRLDTRLGQPLLGHPAGIAVGDVDDDGREDLYLTQPGGVPNALLLHRPDGSVRDGSKASGVDYLDFSRGALLVDLDADGAEDLVVSVVDDVMFHAGGGDGTFEPRALRTIPSSTSLAAADYDLDGDLDLYACAYADPYGGGGLPRPYHDALNGQRNVLVRNDGEWSFVDATESEGLEPGNRRFSFAASWEDVDLDGDPDLYVANDFGRNNLYENLRRGSADSEGREPRSGFVDVAARAGVEDLAAGMGVSFGDANGDGRADLYVSNMFSSAGNRVSFRSRFLGGRTGEVRRQFQRHSRGNSLFLSDGDAGFVAAEDAGVSEAGWAWGARFIDLDTDGWLDLVSPNGLLTQERSDDL